MTLSTVTITRHFELDSNSNNDCGQSVDEVNTQGMVE